jgi:hypothetical protein
MGTTSKTPDSTFLLRSGRLPDYAFLEHFHFEKALTADSASIGNAHEE